MENQTDIQRKTAEFGKKDIWALALICGASLLMVLLLTRNQYLYGSIVDWISQHSVFPDYFRSQFYETGRLFQEFAPHIGGGQNIFHFSYYGYLSPVILPSYLLPGIAMTDYIMISSVVLLLSSGALCYYFIRRHGISVQPAFTAAFLFQFSAGLIYHSHKQIMFVNYMPFLIMALIGTERYLRKRKSGLLVISVFLMIMTSYFYSAGGLLILILYGIYIYLKMNSNWNTAHFIKTGTAYALRLMLGAGMSALLILPSFMAILNGRSTAASGVEPYQLFLPHITLENIVYSPYGIGLTGVGVLALFNLFRRKQRAEQVLGILLGIIFIFPLFLYLLNGGLYLRGKVFLPFLPVMSLITASFLEDLKENLNKGNKVPLMSRRHVLRTGFLLTILFLMDGTPIGLAVLADGFLVLAGFYGAAKKRHTCLLYLPSLIICTGLCIGMNLSDPLVPKTLSAEIKSGDKKALMQLMNASDPSLYRFNDFTNTRETCNRVDTSRSYRTSLYTSTYDADYDRFCTDIIGNANDATNHIASQDSSNILFQTFMGVKYIITDGPAPAGYKPVKQSGQYILYKNDLVFPLGYASSSTLKEAQFNTLDPMEKGIALLQNIIVPDAPVKEYRCPIQKTDLSLPFTEVNNTASARASISLPEPLNRSLLLLSFTIRDIPNQDIVIKAGNIANRLTGKDAFYPNGNFDFQYVISDSEAKKNLDLFFSPGNYKLEHPELSSLPYSEVQKAQQNITPLGASELKTAGTILSGSINVKEDGYFTVTIPYDKGFHAFVDGTGQTIEKVNTAFMGFPIAKGRHTVSFTYQAPLFSQGVHITIISTFLFLLLLLYEAVCRRRRNR